MYTNMKKLRNSVAKLAMINNHATMESFYKRTFDLNKAKSGEKWNIKQIYHQKEKDLALFHFKNQLNVEDAKYFFQRASGAYQEVHCLKVVNYSLKHVVVEACIIEYGQITEMVRINFNDIFISN